MWRYEIGQHMQELAGCVSGCLLDTQGIFVYVAVSTCRLSRMVRSPIVAAISYMVWNYSCRPQVTFPKQCLHLHASPCFSAHQM